MPLITTFGAGSVRGLGRAARLVPPGIPTSFTATGRTRLDGAGGATVSFNAPIDNGGAPITSYQVQNVATMAISTVSGVGDVVPLQNNVEQGFRIRAVNAAGPGEWSGTDMAFAGYQSYFPGNGGGSTTFSLSAGFSSLVYQVYSNGGASAKPDTRTYQNKYPGSFGWWGYFEIIYDPPFYLPSHYTYHREADYASWGTYDTSWNFVSGFLSYSHGNFTAGSYEYYSVIVSGSGPNWTNNQQLGWYTISPYAESVQTGGSPAASATSGTGSYISVPGWGTDSVGGGFGGNVNVTSGTATFNPNSSINVTVNIGYSNGDHAYSSAGYAFIAYGK